MRKIALIMDGWKRFFTYAWPSGILQRIQETNEKVNLYIFNSFGNWNTDQEYINGEYNIFNLPELSDFDGIILDLNNISSEKELAEVIDRVKQSGKPVVSIANEIENFYFAGIDNAAAMRKIISHLYEHHGYRKFWFVMGPTSNYESVCRTKAMKQFLKEHGIDYSEKDFYYGGFDYQSGVDGLKMLLERHDDLPEAIICANDNVAVGVCETAASLGLQIPGDFCVTGFDNFDKAGFYYPSITTISHIREEAGYLATDILIRLWAGQEVPRFSYTSAELICQESCGCSQGSARNLREHLKEQVMYGIESGEFNSEVLSLEAEMMQCSTVEEMMCCIPQCIPSLKCDAMYLVLDNNINAFKEEAGEYKWSLKQSNDGFVTRGYSENMRIHFAYEKDRKVDLANVEVKNIFPAFDCKESGKDFLFLPLHFGKYAVGYLVIRNAVYLMEKQYLFQIINVLTGAIENLHKKEQLEYMNRKLSKLYLTDPLTGIYNRMGYQQMGESHFKVMQSKKKKLLISFIDLDRLKYINDNFGHEYGDRAICAVARTITKYSGADAISARTGGDEFVIVQSYETDEAAEKQLQDMRTELKREKEQQRLPFELSISVGNVVTDPEKELSFEDYVKIADEKMYREKLSKKAERKD